jgi:hypothetical protein
MTISAIQSIPQGLTRRADDSAPLGRQQPIGRSISLLLWRFWDPDAKVLLDRAQQAQVTPVLLSHGMGAFASRYARRSQIDGQGIHGVRARSDQQRLKQTLELLDTAKVRYLVGGAYSHARLYPEPGLRPLDRLELLLDGSDLPRAEQALQRSELRIDYRPFGAEPFEALLERSLLRAHEGVQLRCLGADDELRLLLLKLNAAEPLWLCDVAVLLERGPQTLDPKRVFAGSPAWNACAIQLARDVLGARVPSDLASAVPTERPAAWIERALIARWGRPATTLDKDAFAYLRQPKRWVTVLLDRLPDPIQVNASARVSPQCSPLRAGITVALSAARQLVKRALRVR